MTSNYDRILWLDCLGALAAGVLMLLASGILSRLENLPLSVVIGIAAANIAYGAFSLYVTTRVPRSLFLVNTLAVANMVWLIVCVAVIWLNWNTIFMVGIIHLLGEGVYVASLGSIEWRLRRRLASA